tara:strand:+ start:474 stop:1163 length:690 start_codon:yes stop_codon:yes gene_type:complete
MPASKKIINHIAIIMDGNGRWSKKKLLNKSLGHKAGIDAAIKLCRALSKNRLSKNLTLYTFSTENWKRSPAEISYLFKLIDDTYESFKNVAQQNNIMIKHLGDRARLPKKTLNIIDDVIEVTKSNSGLILNIALNYGGRAEIVNAFNNLKKQNLVLNEKNLNKCMYNDNLPDPEILIRTGGDYRLSNFLLWQSAYTELFFINTLWPDFRYIMLKNIVNKFYLRKRKFGK